MYASNLEDIRRVTVTNLSGHKLNFMAAMSRMDPGIRKEVDESLDITVTDQDYLATYERAHWTKCGTPWDLSGPDPQL